ncbi:polysaccharide biosynthesis protein (plasmid) [Pontibacillus sp. ALD_SL1]|uniref:putative polysaccharide biosynthesis protein n=1 Tax=Pontibacillus sp. ALD_SL1 TaxID=2777185 RepID=UPI001A96AD76|nr:polysaccharide biosynthesis protein [Pontibacillus sp. ALD_SL1]QST02668.1 polysaccharide biosynthesis protein [Pontibacillus sp. ALD_SL1]
MNNLLKGTAILTASQYLSKLLGFLYIIPFIALIGTKGYILFEYAYKPYTIMLSMATLGVPLAISKFVSKYNELKEYKTAKRLFKMAVVFALLSGGVSCLALYSLAPSVAPLLIDEGSVTGNTKGDIIYVIRMISFALILVPLMAVIRGYFQGHGAMIPTAVSQTLEQLVRVTFILAATFFILETDGGELTKAVGMATFAATVGALAGLLVLLWYLKAWKKRLDPYPEPHEMVHTARSKRELMGEMITTALPFVIIGLALPLYQLIETFTVNKPLMEAGYSQLEAETVNSLIALAQKLILIPVGLSTAFGLALLPAITKAHTAGEKGIVHHHMTKTFQVLLFVLVPTTFLFMTGADDLFGIMFGLENQEAGGRIMMWYAPSMILYSFYIVTASMLQGLNREKFAILALLIGVFLKLLLNPYFVMTFEAVGTILTTNIGFLVSIGLHLWWLRKQAQYPFRKIVFQSGTIMVVGFLSTVVGFLLMALFTFITGDQETIVMNLIRILILGGSVMTVYVVASMKTGILFQLMGSRYRWLRHVEKKLKKKTGTKSNHPA